jgi:pyruvate,water dikinase
MKRTPLGLAVVLLACGGGGSSEPTCTIAAGAAAPDYLQRLGCADDFRQLASAPLDATLPGARSVKVVLDQFDGDALYFQNSVKFQIHYQFASKHLSAPRLPLVPSLEEFNRSQYTSRERRFLLGALTYYEGPQVWAYEIAPYDTATPEMITKVYQAVRKAVYFGDRLVFHPTSQAVEARAASLPPSVTVLGTEALFAQIDYQPLNLGEAMGQLRFVTAADLPTTYLGYRDIVVLEAVPNDISVVAGMISQEFQTPLSHINVLSSNRGTPNMGLRKAMTNPALRALEGKWVDLAVGAFEYKVREVSGAEADAWWTAHRPAPVKLPPLDLTVKDLRDIEGVVVEGTVPLREAIGNGVRAFGAKAAGYSVLANTRGIPARKAFAIPAFYYVQFMEQNGFFARVDALLADPKFRDDPFFRDRQLWQLRLDMLQAPLDPQFDALLHGKLDSEYRGVSMRFRSSTNAEDLDGFPCAGCYDSHTGDPAKGAGEILVAIRKTWATVWKFRTFEERAFHGIDHKAVGMALLVHHNFPDEAANGVAVTANPFDPSGLEPGFYVNVQTGGEAEVVAPPPGVTSDEFVYQFTYPGQPVIFLTHSSLVPAPATVLTPAQVLELGTALDAIHKRFAPAFGPGSGAKGFYAMDVEFKFDSESAPARTTAGEPPHLYVKQARPYRGRGTDSP